MGLATTAMAGLPYIGTRAKSNAKTLYYEKQSGISAPNDQIQIALIGAGWIGQVNGATAVELPGIKTGGRLRPVSQPPGALPGTLGR